MVGQRTDGIPENTLPPPRILLWRKQKIKHLQHWWARTIWKTTRESAKPVFFLLSSYKNPRRKQYVFGYAVCPSVRCSTIVCPLTSFFAWRDISGLSGWILMKLGTNIQHVSEHCWKRFQGQRSKVKVRLNAIMGRHAFWWCGVWAHLFIWLFSSIACHRLGWLLISFFQRPLDICVPSKFRTLSHTHRACNPPPRKKGSGRAESRTLGLEKRCPSPRFPATPQPVTMDEHSVCVMQPGSSATNHRADGRQQVPVPAELCDAAERTY